MLPSGAHKALVIGPHPAPPAFPLPTFSHTYALARQTTWIPSMCQVRLTTCPSHRLVPGPEITSGPTVPSLQSPLFHLTNPLLLRFKNLLWAPSQTSLLLSIQQASLLYSALGNIMASLPILSLSHTWLLVSGRPGLHRFQHQMPKTYQPSGTNRHPTNNC